MGLDMYMFARKKEVEGPEEVAYWRKHNALHGWFEARYRKENPDFDQDFNCVDMPLTEELLTDLETDIKAKALTPTSGFFFGNTNYDPSEDAQYDLDAIQNARARLAEGEEVFYYSWW